MQTEPSTAGPPKRKRRWFQFSLRTLCVIVTLFCVGASWIGSQARTIQERKAALASHSRFIILYSFVDGPDRSEVTSPIKRWLGDMPVEHMVLSPDTPPADLNTIRETFPEAEIEVRH